jgi:hypothetical protein
MRHIVIITYDWPPRNAVSVHRPYSWAKCWAENGIKVTVVTAVKQTFDEPLDLHLPALPQSVTVVTINYIGNAGLLAYFKLRALRSAGRVIKRAALKLFSSNLDPRSGWREAARDVVVGIAGDVDCVISTAPPISAHLIAMDMKQSNPKLLWVADYRDLLSHNPLTALPAEVSVKLSRLEIASVGRYADVVTSVSDQLARELSSRFGKPTRRVTNGFDLENSTALGIIEQSKRYPQAPFRIVYTGIIYQGHQDISPILDAIALLLRRGEIVSNEVTVDLYGDRLGRGITSTRTNSVTKFTRLMGHVSREQALTAQRNSDLLLLLVGSQPYWSGILTGKLLEYIVSGRPVLCVGAQPDFEICQVLRETGTGICVSPGQYGLLPNILLNAIKGSTFPNWYRPNFTEISKYSRENIARKLLREIGEYTSL